MKRILLLFISINIFALSSNAQCTPDPQYTSPGIYPDSASGLPISYVGQPYDEVITAVVPADTVVVILVPITVDIDSIVVTQVSGLPTNFNYTCNPTSCSFPGGTSACLNLFSTSNPTTSDIGLNPLTITTTSYVTGGITQDDIIDYYILEIADSSGGSVGIAAIDDASFELRKAYPNPANDQVKIQFITGKQGVINYVVTNLLGSVVEKRTINSNRGINNIYFDTNQLPNGIYTYSVSNGKKLLTRRLVINH